MAYDLWAIPANQYHPESCDRCGGSPVTHLLLHSEKSGGDGVQIGQHRFHPIRSYPTKALCASCAGAWEGTQRSDDYDQPAE